MTSSIVDQQNVHSRNVKGKHRILIVDDDVISREILKSFLVDKYDCLEASNGLDALSLLDTEIGKGNDISAILLDIVMPIMDGFAFLNKKNSISTLNNIPVIVSTEFASEQSEEKVLLEGAWDFVSKPFKPKIISLRIANVIARSEIEAFKKLEYITNYDALTKVYCKNLLFKEIQYIVNRMKDTTYAFVLFDLNHFSYINAAFGENMGDKVLQYMGQIIGEYGQKKDIYPYLYGRIANDSFGIFIPYSLQYDFLSLAEYLDRRLKEFPIDTELMPNYGIYLVTKPMEIEVIFNFALQASKVSKGDYLMNYYFFNEELGKKAAYEKQICDEMDFAIDNEEFFMVYQPKVDINTEKTIGCEALVRWNSHKLGLLSPGVFIPIFEKNGLIVNLDFYVIEHVLMFIKKRLEDGYDLHPTSVNISRVNIHNSHLIDKIVALVDKYQVPKDLVSFEITESAYVKNESLIEELVRDFHKAGFKVLMDDFGSGYSSLNVLRNLDIDILKLDMKFFANTDAHTKPKANIIVKNVIRMAKELGLKIVAEGVETLENVNFLRHMECDYIQGFFYYKPMKEEDYLELVRKRGTLYE